jgi:hypothetical protein
MQRIAILTSFVLVAVVAAFGLPGRPTAAQSACYQETGFCIETSAFQDYFRMRGGTRILGYPVSRTFTLDGTQVQFFQRVVLQLSGNSVNRLNILDQDVMPMTHANGSTFPGPDTTLGGSNALPNPSSPDYADKVIDFVHTFSPNDLDGRHVGFFDLFNTTVPIDLAFPGQTPNPGLVTLLNLEIWGVPTSKPTYDPKNPSFIYQRFQRGIMHYRAEQNVTEGILVADYLKSVITNKNLPPDLAEDMRGSRFFNQYDPSAPNWVRRPGELPNTNLTNAFEPGTGEVAIPVQAAPTATTVPGSVPVNPATTAANVTIQLNDDRVDPGDAITVTVIANDPRGFNWIEWRGDNTDDAALDENHRFDCDSQTQCANVWTVTVTKPGHHTLRARAQTTDDQRTDWSSMELVVREGATVTPVPTGTTAPANTPVSTPAATPVVTPAANPTSSSTGRSTP